jgi:hypothetical protein
MPATRRTYRVDAIDDHHTRLEESWELPQPLGLARRALMRLFLGVRDRPSSLTAGAAETLTASASSANTPETQSGEQPISCRSVAWSGLRRLGANREQGQWRMVGRR